MVDPLSGYKAINEMSVEGSELRESGGPTSLMDALKKSLESGQDIQDFFEKQKDIAINDPDPIVRNTAKNIHNEMLNNLEMQWSLNFLRVGTELAKVPSTLKNG